MAKFRVELKETNYSKLYEIYAETREEARAKARELFDAGDVDWVDCDLDMEVTTLDLPDEE